MRSLLAVLAFLGPTFGAAAMPAHLLTAALQQEVAHSGGCRKSSPPGARTPPACNE